MVSSALNFLKSHLVALVLGGALILAAGSGFLTSVAIGAGVADPPRTVTIDVGATGPTGPTGPPGPPGAAAECPANFALGFVVFNTPGGHETIYACLKQP